MKMDELEQYDRRQNLEFQGVPQTEKEDKKFFLRFLWCSRLALRNHTGATQKTNFITDVSLVRNN